MSKYRILSFPNEIHLVQVYAQVSVTEKVLGLFPVRHTENIWVTLKTFTSEMVLEPNSTTETYDFGKFEAEELLKELQK